MQSYNHGRLSFSRRFAKKVGFFARDLDRIVPQAFSCLLRAVGTKIGQSFSPDRAVHVNGQEQLGKNDQIRTAFRRFGDKSLRFTDGSVEIKRHRLGLYRCCPGNVILVSHRRFLPPHLEFQAIKIAAYVWLSPGFSIFDSLRGGSFTLSSSVTQKFGGLENDSAEYPCILSSANLIG